MIISSYALIFLAAVIAAVYLFGYYFHTGAVRSAQTGLMAALVGAVLWAAGGTLAGYTTAHADGAAAAKYVAVASLGAAIATAIALAVLMWRRAAGLILAGLALLLGALLSLGTAPAGFSHTLGLVLFWAGLGWALLNGTGLLLRRRGPAVAAAARDLARTGTLAGPQPGLALAGPGTNPGRGLLRWQRPVLAGGAPGDERTGVGLPAWLHNMDWSHLIILNMAFIILFGGVILGAVWADYSWGRPWGWDPKETFAMNTWLIYAVLIHARFIVQRKGLWTAWLSVLGCAMMAFNWFVVNFYIVGLHSYA
jgi:ABC-type transport system involved in cytochrome c biogenesis permease subunit